MSTTKSKGGRPAGSSNVRPSKEAIAGYYRQLQHAANRGDAMAQAALIQIYERHCSEQAGSKTHGV